MNGSGGNLAGCATCAGRCCRQYRVEVTVADVRTLAAGTGLAPADFVVLAERRDSAHSGFRLEPGGKVFELDLIRARSSGACVFLMEIDEGIARCGVYPHRPLVCRNFPATVRNGAIGVREEVACGPDSWNLAAMDLTTYRRDLTRSEVAWAEHWRVVSAWNARVAADPAVTYAPADLFEFLLADTAALG